MDVKYNLPRVKSGTSFEDLGYSQFSETETYAVGDVVIYEGSLYKFTSAHSAGSWVGTDAEETSINQEIASEHAGRVAGDAMKINEPSQEGTSGQVLTTDGNGGRRWTTPHYTPMPRVTDIPVDDNYNPNTLYVLEFGTTARTINLAAGTTGYAAEYHILFTTGGTAPTITWPAELTWADGNAPVIKANMTYELNVLEGKAVVKEWGVA